MRYALTVLLLPLAATLGLSGKARPQQNQSRPPTTQRVENQSRSQEANQYPYEQRAEYQLKLQNVLNRLNQEIDTLEKKAHSAGTRAQEEYRKQLPELRRLRDNAQTELRKVERASPGAWSDIKQGIGNAVDDLRTAIDRAKRNYR